MAQTIKDAKKESKQIKKMLKIIKNSPTSKQ